MLEELNLSGNNLTEFPSFILDLPRLKVLHLAENQIQSVPADIGRLNQLERLYLGKNCLRDIPRQVNFSFFSNFPLGRKNFEIIKIFQIESITGLRVLSLANNHLQSVPVEIGNLNSLVSLQLHQNKINYLPRCIVELAGLEELSLR